MKFLCLAIFSLLSLNISAQNVWIEYCSVMADYEDNYYEDRIAVAKEWGINYKVETIGCEPNEKRHERQKRGTEKYFKTLAEKFGKDWRKRFDFDVLKRKPIFTSTQDSVWVNLITGQPNVTYIDTKKEVAKKWGINYQPIFVDSMLNESEVKELLNRVEETNKHYLDDIEMHFGDDWQEKFEAEVQARLKENQETNHKK
ncbi:MAG: hypothetical protein GY810_09915 [Aureispira sp.]|nr:hypothetical protein [Aureispira sp.]